MTCPRIHAARHTHFPWRLSFQGMRAVAPSSQTALQLGPARAAPRFANKQIGSDLQVFALD